MLCQCWLTAFLEWLLSLPYLKCLIRSLWADYFHRVVIRSKRDHTCRVLDSTLMEVVLVQQVGSAAFIVSLRHSLVA